MRERGNSGSFCSRNSSLFQDYFGKVMWKFYLNILCVHRADLILSVCVQCAPTEIWRRFMGRVKTLSSSARKENIKFLFYCFVFGKTSKTWSICWSFKVQINIRLESCLHYIIALLHAPNTFFLIFFSLFLQLKQFVWRHKCKFTIVWCFQLPLIETLKILLSSLFRQEVILKSSFIEVFFCTILFISEFQNEN